LKLGKEVLTLDLASLDLGGAWLFWSKEPEPGPIASPGASLAASLEAVGQLAPVLVEPDPTRPGAFLLLDGARRVAALAGRGAPVLAVRVLPPEGEDERAALLRRGLIYLAANRPASAPPEPGRALAALRYFQPLLAPDALTARIAPLLGFSPQSRVWRRHLEWIALFSPDSAYERALRAERLPLDAVDLLAKLDSGERAALAPFFEQARWSVGNCRQFLQCLHEGARMRGERVTSALAPGGLDPRAQLGALAEGLSPKDWIEGVLVAVRRYRWPASGVLAERFGRLARELTAGTRWRLAPGLNFEKNGLTLSTHVADRESLAAAQASLAGMAGSPLWDRLATLAEEDA
jgi:hypothetical protein